MSDAPRPAGQDVGLIELAAENIAACDGYSYAHIKQHEQGRYVDELQFWEGAAEAVIAAVRPVIAREAKRVVLEVLLEDAEMRREKFVNTGLDSMAETYRGVGQFLRRHQRELTSLETDE